MWTKHFQQQVNRNLGLLTEAEQEKIRTACVAVCGLGGLGGIIAEILARTGVESFVLLDHGCFEPTNLNRQIFCFSDTEGQRKTDVTEDFLKRINPAIKIRKFQTVTGENINEVLAGVDVVALSVDDIRAIIRLARGCYEKNIPLVEGWAVMFGNVRVFTSETPTLEDVYRLPTANREVDSISEDESKDLVLYSLMQLQRVEGLMDYYSEENVQRLRQKGEGTTLAPTVWLTSVLMANEVFKILVGWGKLALAPNLEFYDPMQFRIPGETKTK